MRALLALFALLLSSCADLSPQTRWQHADRLAFDVGWHRIQLDTQAFDMTGYVPELPESIDTLTVYVEGDGLAWFSRTQPSPDPTPRVPVGLQLAIRHEGGGAVYLARPCQYTQSANARNCHSRYWTTHRFSPEVIDATNESIALLKERYRAKHLILVGYSGGGAVAALVAARRQDVVHLITVAGNLDPKKWTELHRVTPLSGSLNPADFWQALQSIPQTHFLGAQDKNIPYSVFESYAERFPSNRRPDAIILDGQDHHCCWVAEWPNLLIRTHGLRLRL